MRFRAFRPALAGREQMGILIIAAEQSAAVSDENKYFWRKTEDWP